MKLNFKKSPEVERVLSGEFGLDWEWQEIPLEEIDLESSLGYQIRWGSPVLPETIESYALSFKRGDTFPGIVWRKSKGGVEVVDGNQRTMGYRDAEMPNPNVGGYCLLGSIDDVTFREVAWRLNDLNGQRMSREQLERSLIFLWDAGKSPTEAARSVGVDTKRASDVIAREAGLRRAEDAGYSPRGDAVSRWQRLHAIKSDRVYNEAAQLVVQRGVPSGAVSELVAEINANPRSTKKQLQVVTEWKRERPWESKETKQRREWSKGWKAALGHINSQPGPSSMGWTDDQWEGIEDDFRSALAKLMQYLHHDGWA